MTVINDDAFLRLFQERAGLEPDGWAGKATLAALDKVLPPARAPASVSTQIPDSYWPMLSKIESGDRPYIQAASSSASGLYQFIRSTWEGEGGKWGPTLRPAFGGLKPSPEEQLARAKTFTAKNAAYLAKHGIPINRASLYAAHFFGPVTAAAVIGADVKADASAIAGPGATKANPSILTRVDDGKRRGATVGEFLTWLHGKTGEWAR
jgi:peptidoglycan hydrolase-like protein with peptidoglycan-binding domain